MLCETGSNCQLSLFPHRSLILWAHFLTPPHCSIRFPVIYQGSHKHRSVPVLVFWSWYLAVQSLSHVWLFATPWLQHARLPCPSPSPEACSNSCPLSQWCHPTTSSFVTFFSSCPQIFPRTRIFSNESALRIRWPKFWNFSFSISPSNEYSGLISFRIDWFDLRGVQGTVKSLLQNHDSKASVLQCSAFSMVQFSHPYMTTGKPITLTIQTFVGKMTSLLFDMLPRFVVPFLPRSKSLLIHDCSHHLQWFWSPRK